MSFESGLAQTEVCRVGEGGTWMAPGVEEAPARYDIHTMEEVSGI